MKNIEFLAPPAAVVAMVWAAAFMSHSINYKEWYYFPSVLTACIIAGFTVGSFLFWLGDD